MKTKTPPKIITILTTIALFLIPGLAFLDAPATHAVAYDICTQGNVDQAVRDANGCNGSASTNLANTITAIINAVIGVIGIVAVIFIIVGGVNYMTSAGDTGKLQKARQTIIWAVVGLVIAALAFTIVNFVIKGILKQ